jgi:hypothetical protein
VCVREPHRALLQHEPVFLRRPINRRHGVAAIVADEVQDFGIVQAAALTVRRVVRATGEHSNQERQHLHGFLRGNKNVNANRRVTPYTATPLPSGMRRFRAEPRESQPDTDMFSMVC